MTHSLAEEKVDDDSAASSARTAERQRDTGEASAESGSTGVTRTASQGPVVVAGLVFGQGTAEKDGDEAASSGPESGAPKSAKVPRATARPTIPGDIEFEWTGWEVLGFPPEITAARADYAKTMIWLAFLKVNLVPTMPDELKPALEANLSGAERMLVALARRPIAIADRFEAIKAIEMWSKAVERTVETARRERDAVLAVQARMAAELDAAMEMVERLEAEEAARIEAEAEAHRQAEELERQVKEAADRAAAQKLAEEHAKAEAERVALAEAAAAKAEQERLAREAEEARKRAEVEEAEQKRIQAEKAEQAKAERERLEAQAARDKLEEAERQRIQAEKEEQARRSRRALFGENQAAFDAAIAAATRIADADLAKTILALEGVRDEAEDRANAAAKDSARKTKGQNRSKARATRPTAQSADATANPTASTGVDVPPRAPHLVAFDQGTESAEAEHGASVASRVGKFGALASSQKGAGLDPADLTWAIETSGGNVAIADALVGFCALGAAGVALARDIATHQDLSALLALSATLIAVGVPLADIANGAVALNKLDYASANWVKGVVGPNTSVAAAVSFLSRHKSHKLAMLVGTTSGVGTANDDLIASIIETKSTPTAIGWLLSQPAPDLTLMSKAIVSKNLQVDAVRTVVEPNTPSTALTLLLQIMTNHPQQISDLPALLKNAPVGLPQMAMMRLRLGANDTQNSWTVAAMKTEAQLMAGHMGVITCTRRDIYYVGQTGFQAHNDKMNARTGFLNLPLLGARHELHVHWEDNGSMELTSMHIQIDGVNGPELNQIMNFFPLMIAKAVDRLNALGTTGGGRVKTPKGR